MSRRPHRMPSGSLEKLMSEARVPAIAAARPEPYRPPGEGEVRDSLLNLIESLPHEERMPFALAFAVMRLEDLGKNSLTPSGKRIGLGTADAIRHLIPADVIERIEAVAKAKGLS